MQRKLLLEIYQVCLQDKKWNEEYYNPFSVTSASYFVDDLNKLIIEQPIDSKPGKAFKYQSGTTQLLAMVIKKATKENLSNYLQKNFGNL